MGDAQRAAAAVTEAAQAGTPAERQRRAGLAERVRAHKKALTQLLADCAQATQTRIELLSQLATGPLARARKETARLGQLADGVAFRRALGAKLGRNDLEAALNVRDEDGERAQAGGDAELARLSYGGLDVIGLSQSRAEERARKQVAVRTRAYQDKRAWRGQLRSLEDSLRRVTGEE